MPNNVSNINALVIDNNSSMKQIIVSMLRAMGMKTVIVANTENQCVQLIASESINLVVCGWNLPKLNALSILKRLRGDEQSVNIPFVIVSTLIEQEKIKEAIAYGVSEYLVPPFNMNIFENRIHKALKVPIQASAKSLSRAVSNKRFSQKSNIDELDILVVDDIADNISIIAALIKNKYRMKAALNAKTAMKICLSDSPPDLILLDIMMPEVSGLTLCKQLKENPLTQNIVVIFLTALSETEDVVKGLSLGAVDYITKPIIAEILLARIEVHSKIILNQRIIQGQIDSLLLQSDLLNQYNENLYRKLSELLRDSSETLTNLSSKMNEKSSLISISKLKYNLAMSQTLLDKKHILTQLKQGQYTVKMTKENLANLLYSTMRFFDFSISRKNIEGFVKVDKTIDIQCDRTLLKNALSCLYNHALDAALRGSKVALTAEQYHKFILIKLHNITAIPEKEIKSITHLSPTNKTDSFHHTGINLAFLAIEKMQGALYFHSSEKYGTTFYIKLPN
jgi:PleD family two-component response regulator